MKIQTKLLHGYPVIDPETGASSIPKYQASTFHQADFLTHTGYNYTRFGNPTVEALEKCIATLEEANYGLAFGSGMAAISSVLLLLSQGDHIVLCRDIYGGTYQALMELLVRYGIDYTFVDQSDLTSWESAIQPNTKMMYLETPSNPLLSITDIESVVALAKKNNIMTVCDNTFMTPCYQQPLTMGVDVVIHSATKFINGHSDVVAGLLALNNSDIYNKLKTHQKVLGAILGTEDAWLVLRGVKTLGLRMRESAKSAMKIAEFLDSCSAVKQVFYPGLTTHENHELHFKQASSGGAVLSFELKNVEQVHELFRKAQLPLVAVSLGGVESILSYPWTMSHACMPESERLSVGVTPLIVRLSVGIEDVEDLIDDLKNCLI